MSEVVAPLWLRSLAWSAGYTGCTASDLVDAIAPELRASLSTMLGELPAGDARARAKALIETRRRWTRAGRPAIDDAALTKLGARMIASMIAHTPASARAVLARSFEAESVRAATSEVRSARTCDSLALQSLVDAVARVTMRPPTALALGSIAFAALVDDTDAPTVAYDALRSLRAAGRSTSMLEPFRGDAQALLAEVTR